jgi:hypothetical protein
LEPDWEPLVIVEHPAVREPDPWPHCLGHFSITKARAATAGNTLDQDCFPVVTLSD